MMIRLFSAALQGVEATQVEVEVNATHKADFRLHLVGLPDAAVRESSQRVLSALDNSGLTWPQGNSTISAINDYLSTASETKIRSFENYFVSSKNIAISWLY